MLNLVGEATVYTTVSFSDCFCHQKSLSDFLVKINIYIYIFIKKCSPFISPSSSTRRWRFPATFQVHYRDLCWDYDKNTCFLPFWSDQGHFSLSFFFFSAISYQSCTQLNDLPLFKQLTSLAAKEPTGSRTLSLFLAGRHLRSCCSSLYQSHLLLMSRPRTALSFQSWCLSVFPFKVSPQ